jgi:HEPN domain-containing protein
MKQMRTRRMWALLAVLALPACDESGVGLLDGEPTPDEAAELALLEDQGSLEIPFELTETTSDVAASLGGGDATEGRLLSAQARARFFAARESLRDGDHRRALELARHARLLAARALVAAGGVEAVEALVERLEELLLTLDAEDDDVFDDPEALRERLEALTAEARALLESGELVAAAERALLGEQLVRFHRGRRDFRGDVAPERARLAVDLAGTAVALAERLVRAGDTPVREVDSSEVLDRMNRWLVYAKRYIAVAEHALEQGRYARAVHFAWHAHVSALKAVILPGGITEEELQAMADLANTLYEEALVAVGDDPTELEERLLALAGRLLERGEQALEEGRTRGVAALWRAAVISSWLIG